MKDSSVEVSAANPGSPPGSTATSLVERVKTRDPVAWTQFTTLYGPVVYAWVRRTGLAADDAADVTQDVFRAVVNGVQGFRYARPGDTFRGWLWTVTRNKVRDWRRAGSERPVAIGGSDALQRMLHVPDEKPSSTSAGADVSERCGLVRRAVELAQGEFEPRTWQAFWRVTVEGQAPSDVARDLGITANAVYVARCRVLRRLRELLDDHDPGGDEP